MGKAGTVIKQVLETYGISQNKLAVAMGIGRSSINRWVNENRDPGGDAILIAQKHGAYNVRVFGSVARGEATEDSDIDFLVDYDLEKITPWFPGGLLIDLEQLLNRKVDIATVDMLKERSRDRILHEAVLL